MQRVLFRSLISLRLLMMLTALALPAASQAQGVSDEVETDVQEYSRFALRHDSLLLRLNLKRITNDELAEMDRMKAQGQQIAAKYASGGPRAADAATFERRRKELSASVVQPGVMRAVAQAFPEPGEVAARFDDAVDRAAAMQVLAETLKAKAGKPLVPEVTAKAQRYEAAVDEINPRNREEYVRQLNAIRARRLDPQFKFDVLSQFMPVYAPEADAPLAEQRYAGRVADAQRGMWIAVGIVAAVVAAMPAIVVVAMMLLRRGTPPNSRKPFSNPFLLPDELRRIQLPGRSFTVDHRCGQVTRKRARQEIFTRTTINTGQGRDAWGQTVQAWDSPAAAVRYDSGTSSSDTTIVNVYEYSIVAPNGTTDSVGVRAIAKKADIEEGHLLSAVVGGRHRVLCYNHTTGQFYGTLLPPNKRDRALWTFVWVACAVAAYVAYGVIVSPLLTAELTGEDAAAAQKAQMVLIVVTVLALPYVSMCRKYIDRSQAKQIERWRAKFKAHCESITAPLVAHFARAAR
jgi:hypothetical protein